MTLKTLARAIKDAGGHALLVGGAVRDSFLGQAPKDLDLEVFGLPKEALAQLLTQFGSVKHVGASFGVFKLTLPDGQELDVSLPRRERKDGPGHKGFDVTPDETMTLAEAAARRDFTFNALALDPLTGRLFDLFGGRADLRAGVLRHTTARFAEDPLRVLRGMQFAARFDLVGAGETVLLAQSLWGEFHTLSTERIWGEWHKWGTKGRKPSAGLRWLSWSGWLQHFPELLALQDCPQDPLWHPEGDAWAHTLAVCDAAAQLAERDALSETERLVLLLAALCHDLGKPATTTQSAAGRWISPKHAQAGEAPTRQLLGRLGAPKAVTETVVSLVKEHMAHLGQPSARKARRLLHRLGDAPIKLWALLVEADHSGRPPLQAGLPDAARQLRSWAQEHGDRIEPILKGRHLLALGLQPGPEFGRLLRAALQAQLDGEFADLADAQAWISQRLADG